MTKFAKDSQKGRLDGRLTSSQLFLTLGPGQQTLQWYGVLPIPQSLHGMEPAGHRMLKRPTELVTIKSK